MINFDVYIPTTVQRDTLNEILVYLEACDVTPILFPNNAGKEMFWSVWNDMLKTAEQSEAELFIFMPDDFTDLDLERIKEIHEAHKCKPYAFNIINDGRNGLFNGVVPVTIDDKIMCGFVDCGFFCNREALDAIGYYMEQTEVKKDSSGVGRRLSNRFLKARVTMYKPVTSLAWHGDQESIMHKEERRKNPLISL
jgi:hypothetical protein